MERIPPGHPGGALYRGKPGRDALDLPVAQPVDTGEKGEKNELADYRKKRIHLDQVLHDFKEIYMTHVDDDGRCQRKECAPLAKLRVTIVEGCPVAGESFPLFAAE
ncbi:MAG: hypothetical protein E4G96_10865 [Chrysiogenales bacterium]|nr:MAG: hypothetical protein E4G96_10865 [Chrysiogenales bacterium]